MSALVEQSNDYTHADTTVAKLFRASQIDAATKISIDFLDPQCYPSGVVPATAVPGQQFVNLVDGSPLEALTAPAALAINSAGLKFTGSTGQYIDFGAEGMFPAGSTMIGFGGWIKNRDNSADAQAYSALGGYQTATTDGASQWNIQRAKGAGAYVGWGGLQSASATITLAVDEVAHVFWVATLTGGNVTTRAYKNGALVATGTPRALAAFPTPAGAARIGQVQGYSQSCNCEVGSWDMEDFSAAGAQSVTDFLARAYGDNVGRFV